MVGQNLFQCFCVLLLNFCVLQRNFAFAHNTFEFPWKECRNFANEGKVSLGIANILRANAKMKKKKTIPPIF